MVIMLFWVNSGFEPLLSCVVNALCYLNPRYNLITRISLMSGSF